MQTVELQNEAVSDAVNQISQSNYGDHTLDAISGAGRLKSPKLALVFINPTHRNISTRKEWTGLKAPWIGCANIWQLFADAGLIDEGINKNIQLAKTEWSYDFASEVYSHIAARNLYITNIVKWAGLDAKLPEKDKIKLYAPILIQELGALQPDKVIAFGQLTFTGILNELRVRSSMSFGELNEHMLANKRIEGVDTKLGLIVPTYFPVGQGIKNKAKAIEVLGMAYSG